MPAVVVAVRAVAVSLGLCAKVEYSPPPKRSLFPVSNPSTLLSVSVRWLSTVVSPLT